MPVVTGGRGSMVRNFSFPIPENPEVQIPSGSNPHKYEEDYSKPEGPAPEDTILYRNNNVHRCHPDSPRRTCISTAPTPPFALQGRTSGPIRTGSSPRSRLSIFLPDLHLLQSLWDTTTRTNRTSSQRYTAAASTAGHRRLTNAGPGLGDARPSCRCTGSPGLRAVIQH